jgi:hypothetical protein
MSKRLLGVPLLALLVLVLSALPALATESAEEEREEVDAAALCSANDVVAEYCPDPYESPTVFRGILYPLLGVAALVSIALFLLYIRWLPNFAQERRARARGRR